MAAEEEAWKIERQKGLEEIQTLKQSAEEAQQAARAAETKIDGMFSLGEIQLALIVPHGTRERKTSCYNRQRIGS